MRCCATRLAKCGEVTQTVAVAIQFARARYISRSSGGSAVRSAAYNARESIGAERTGEVFYFRNRDAPEHHEVLLPDGAADRFADAGVLWNAAEAAERRKDAQVAREIVLALPANAELSTEDRVAMARAFAAEHFVSKGLAVQLDVHAPHGAESESERANWHAHLLITTRRLEGETFSAKKARDLDPEVRSAGGRARVADGTAWGEFWRDHQDQYFREHGLAARVDPSATHAQEHIGPVRMRRTGAEIVERAEIIRQANQEAARDPVQVLAALTRNNATFTARDLERFLIKQLGQEGKDASAEVADIRASVLGHGDVLTLHDRQTGEVVERFTTRQVREEERGALRAAAALAFRRTGAVSERCAREAEAARTLRPDQAEAFRHATGAGHIKLIEGRAGTGKSYTLAAIRDAHARDGKRVVGLAPTNAVAQDLAADGFADAGTVHSALFRLKNGRTAWDRDTVVVVDEAAMLDTRVTGELLTAVRQAGAKIILAGDDRQLASIERGGLFSELRQRHGAAEITEVTRQKVEWQRQAARDLAEGRFAEAVGAFDKAGAITWTNNQEAARSALVAAWKRDGEVQPAASRFVFAYTNRDVDTLNAELRQVRRERGELTGADVAFDTKHGRASFAVGDRVQFTDTDKRLHIYNGNVATITGIDRGSGEITARLDAAGKDGRVVTWSPAAFEGFRHGYAGTIYKGQGKTLDRTYLYHTEHWRSAASYVALTRQRESAQIFVARETARDAGQLARQMGRGEVRAASMAWATADELVKTRADRTAQPHPANRETPRERAGEIDPAAAYWKNVAASPGTERDEDRLRAKVREALAARQRSNPAPEKSDSVLSPDARAVLAALHAKIDREFTGSPEERAELKADVVRQLAAREARDGPVKLTEPSLQAGGPRTAPAEPTPAPLLPAWRDATGQGRDSLGRGTSPDELRRVADQDPEVMRQAAMQKRFIQVAYRDPLGAADALEALIKNGGRDLRAAAEQLRKSPEILGKLHGRGGWLATPAAQGEHAQAKSTAWSIASSLDRESDARASAVGRHTEAVTQQRGRDAVEVPGLSKAALSALDTVQLAIRATQQACKGERYDMHARRQEQGVAEAWAAARAVPSVAAELGRFMEGAERRLGEAGMQLASRVAKSGEAMTVPGAGKEHQAGLETLARSFVVGREAVQRSAAWEQRLGREAQAAERETARGAERTRAGLPPEPTRERQRQGRDLGLSR
jgi:Ti-type conjugative transfer relaxase TraA